MLIERLEAEYGKNNPIFMEEIVKTMSDYSKQSVYRLVADEIKNDRLVRYDTGIYYIPKVMEFGRTVPSVERVITKKYIRDKDNVFGIYGKYAMELNFDLSTQVPNTIEVITNNVSRAIREIEIRGRRIVLRKSRLPITKENASSYTLLELFNCMDLKEYNERVKNSVLEFIEEEKVTKEKLMNIAYAFPAKALRNIVLSGVINEIA